MPYLIAIGLLIALAGWLLAIYQRLHDLHSQACHAWQQWIQITHLRNEQISSFASAFSGYLPQGARLPRDLRRLAEDSERHICHPLHHLPPGESSGFPSMEPTLRRMIDASLHTLENDERMRNSDQLVDLCGRLCLTLRDQENSASQYNSIATAYNDALQSSSARLVAPLFGLDFIRILR